MAIRLISGTRKAEGTPADAGQSAQTQVEALAFLPPAVSSAVAEETPSVALPLTPFQRALNFVRGREGGLNDDPLDPGNAGGNKTMFGITQRTFNAWRDKLGLGREKVETIREEEANEIYLKEYWEPGKCGELSTNLATAHLDACVNHGPDLAARMLQRALNTLPGNRLRVDGEIGPKTHAAILRSGESRVLEAYIHERERHYREDSPKRARDRFLRGWLNRLDALKKAVGLDAPEEL